MRTVKFTSTKPTVILPAGVYAGIIADIRFARKGNEILHNEAGEYAIEVFLTEAISAKTVSKIIWVTERGQWVIENLYKALGKRYDASKAVSVSEVQNMRVFFIMADIINVYEDKEEFSHTEVSPYFYPYTISGGQPLMPIVDDSKLKIKRDKIPKL